MAHFDNELDAALSGDEPIPDEDKFLDWPCNVCRKQSGTKNCMGCLGDICDDCAWKPSPEDMKKVPPDIIAELKLVGIDINNSHYCSRRCFYKQVGRWNNESRATDGLNPTRVDNSWD